MSPPVFTYGTLQIPAVMEAVTGRKFKSVSAVLENYGRFRIKNQIFPGITPVDGDNVDGTVYFDLDNRSLDFLDSFEDVLYVRTQTNVICDDQKIPAQVYVVGENYRDLLTKDPWDIRLFQEKHLDNYIRSCRMFHEQYKKLL